jgi:TonB family protein
MPDGHQLAAIALKSTGLLGAAYWIAYSLRHRSAAARSLVWTAAFAALFALPILSVSLPALRVPVDSGLLAPGAVFQATASASGSEHSPAASTSPDPVRLNWHLALTLVWAIGVGVSLVQMLAAAVALRRIRGSARHLRIPDVHACAQALGVAQEIEVLETGPGLMPMTSGVFRPAVMLPSDAAGWTQERRRMVLLHEFAHVRRGDTATHLLARTALALHWWNPLAWIAWREFLKERERAADDLVLNTGVHAAEYAGLLLDAARGAAPGWAAIAMARPSQLEGRLLAILDSSRNRNAPQRASAIAAALLAAIMVTPLAALQPRPDASERMIREGIAALSNQEFEEALALFLRAGTDPAFASTATMWMGVVRDRQDRASDAEALYRRALAVAAPDSSEAATTMELCGRLLRRQGRTQEAASLESRAAAVRRMHVHGAQSTSGAYRVGNGVSAPELIFKLEPQYTEEARAARYEGTVVVHTEIGTDGRAQNISIIRSLGLGLNERAIEAISQWRFKPASKDGLSVPVRATIEVNFRLF